VKRFFLIVLFLVVSGCDGGGSGTHEEQANVTTGKAAQHTQKASPEPGEEPASKAPRSLDELLPETFELLLMPWRGDLDGMVERRFIRVLVVSGSPQFFYYKGKPRGLVSELLAMFQQELNATLGRRLDQVEVLPMPVSRDHLIPALLSGQADLVAADLTITDARLALVDFSVPFKSGVDEVLVFAPGTGDGVAVLDDLSGESVYVRKSSSYYEHVSILNAELVNRGKMPIKIIEANELLRTEDILEMVNGGLVGATVVDSYKASYWSEVFPDMVVRDDLVVHGGGEIAWAFRKDSPQLAGAVNDFIKGHRQGTLVGNVLIDRYMGNLHWVRNSTSESGLDILQPLMKDFSASAAESGLDPLMLAAQAYQESELDHSKKSPAGAVGIMQIKPSTALDPNVGIKDVSTPSNNIRAGARYLRFLIDRYYSGDDMEELQRWFFALAAYNAGPARVQRMRRQAEAEGYDPNRWLDNVEVIAARKIGRETVRYVRNVFKYYVAYQLAWENRVDQQAVTTDTQ
jgi:membrane-bound lytic murein transglycosylase MltF